MTGLRERRIAEHLRAAWNSTPGESILRTKMAIGNMTVQPDGCQSGEDCVCRRCSGERIAANDRRVEEWRKTGTKRPIVEAIRLNLISQFCPAA